MEVSHQHDLHSVSDDSGGQRMQFTPPEWEERQGVAEMACDALWLTAACRARTLCLPCKRCSTSHPLTFRASPRFLVEPQVAIYAGEPCLHTLALYGGGVVCPHVMHVSHCSYRMWCDITATL